jgi:hypothetical protein
VSGQQAVTKEIGTQNAMSLDCLKGARKTWGNKAWVINKKTGQLRGGERPERGERG